MAFNLLGIMASALNVGGALAQSKGAEETSAPKPTEQTKTVQEEATQVVNEVQPQVEQPTQPQPQPGVVKKVQSYRPQRNAYQGISLAFAYGQQASMISKQQAEKQKEHNKKLANGGK